MKLFQAALAITTVSAEDKKCTALAMSGGGTKGAFEAGVLWGMYHSSDDKSKF